MHNTVQVSVGNMSADIDEKIAPLIKAIWGKGIETKISCQDYGENSEDPSKYGWALIGFDSENVRKFLDKIQVPTKKLGLSDMKGYPWPLMYWYWESAPYFDTDSQLVEIHVGAIFPIESVENIILALGEHNENLYGRILETEIDLYKKSKASYKIRSDTNKIGKTRWIKELLN